MRVQIIRKGKPVGHHFVPGGVPHIGQRLPGWGEVTALKRDPESGEVQVHVA